MTIATSTCRSGALRRSESVLAGARRMYKPVRMTRRHGGDSDAH